MSIMRKIIVVFFFSLFLSSVSFAQASYKQTDILKAYKEAEELVNLGKYAVAQPFLQDFIQK